MARRKRPKRRYPPAKKPAGKRLAQRSPNSRFTGPAVNQSSPPSMKLPKSTTRAMANTAFLTGVDVLDLKQLQFKHHLTFSLPLQAIQRLIPAKYPYHRDFIQDPAQRTLDRVVRYCHAEAPPGMPPVEVDSRPAPETTFRQVAALIPAEYFPAAGDGMGRFLQGVILYLQAIRDNRHNVRGTGVEAYAAEQAIADSHRAESLNQVTSQPHFDDRDATVAPEPPGTSEESAIPLDSEDENDKYTTELKSEAVQQPTGSNTSASNRTGTGQSKKRRRMEEDQSNDNAAQQSAPSSARKASSTGTPRKKIAPCGASQSLIPTSESNTSPEPQAALEQAQVSNETRTPLSQTEPTAMAEAILENAAAADGDSSTDDEEDAEPKQRRSGDKILIKELMDDKVALQKQHEEEMAAVLQAHDTNAANEESRHKKKLKRVKERAADKLEAATEKLNEKLAARDRDAKSLTKKNAALRKKNSLYESLLMKGAGFSKMDLEGVRVRIEQDIYEIRPAFEMYHSCERRIAVRTARGARRRRTTN